MRRRSSGALLWVFVLVAAVLPVGASAATAAPTAAADFTPSSQVNFTLQGCRNDGNPVISLPDGSGRYVCPDAAYTNGNLGKGWNELDLVPHRLTTSAGSQSSATTDYDVIVAADNLLGTKVGYDVVSVPVVNAAKSHASCSVVAAGPQSTGPGVTGGADQTIFRKLSLHQDKGTTCVLDYYLRLALGASQYSGSSLQSYMFEQADFKGGKQTISIPVNQILPQALSKDMTASQDSDHVWSVTKSPSPAHLDFGDTCATGGGAQQKGVAITVSWERLPATPSGPITVLTHVYATNPAARTVTVSVSDQIRSGTTVLDTTPTTTTDVPANTKQLVLTHQTTVPSGTTDLNDVATASYTDTVTGVPVPGTTTAAASAAVQLNAARNQSATITDVEQITGDGLTFSVDSVTGSGAPGSFAGDYTLGTAVTGPLTWTSAAQSGNGSVTFNKTVHLDRARVTTGSLSDTATLTGSNGFTTSSSASVDVSSSATVALTIDKSIPNVLTGTEAATFGFVVHQGADTSGATVATPTLSFAAGDTSRSVTVSGLAPGTYTVEESTPPLGWNAQPPQTVTIALPSCSGSVSLTNSYTPAVARVQKVTVPSGSAAGWTFELHLGDANGTVLATVVSPETGFVAFPDLAEGSYTITEKAPPAGTPAPQFEAGAASGECSFSVDYPLDAGRTFSCTYTNVQRATAQVKKVTVPAGSEAGWTFDLRSGGSGGAVIGSATTTGTGEVVFTSSGSTVHLTSGTYTITEQGKAGFDNTATSGDCSFTVDLSAPAYADAGRTYHCTYTNTQRGSLQVTKSVDWKGITPDPSKTFEICITGPSHPTPSCKSIGSAGGVLTWEDLVPGAYAVTETDPGAEWTVAVSGSPSTVPAGGQGTATVTNVRKLGSLQVTKSVDWKGITPDPSKTFEICITGPSHPTPSCKSIGSAGGVLTWEDLVPGAYAVTETDPGAEWTVAVSGSPASVPTDGGTATVGVTNTRKLGSLQVTKTVSWNGVTPIGGQTFQICITGPSYPDATSPGRCASFGASGGSYTWTNLIPGAYTVGETDPGTSWTVDVSGSPASVPVDGGRATATVTNTFNPGSVAVHKTKDGRVLSGSDVFTFQLRQGASTTDVGTVVETQVANAANGGSLSFATKLYPGQHYQLCELVMPGWNTDLSPGTPFVPGSIIPPTLPNPNVDNSPVCVDFVAVPGPTALTFAVDNSYPGGLARTIGFWKNWASCSKSNGKQKAVLDETLAKAEPTGVVVSAQRGTYPAFEPNLYLVLRSGDCAGAVRLLDKSTTDTGKKMASDPAFNLAAQLLAAELNFTAGAAKNGTVITAVNQAVVLLGKYGFDGRSTWKAKVSPADASAMNNLARILDDYNNNR